MTTMIELWPGARRMCRYFGYDMKSEGGDWRRVNCFRRVGGRRSICYVSNELLKTRDDALYDVRQLLS